MSRTRLRFLKQMTAGAAGGTVFLFVDEAKSVNITISITGDGSALRDTVLISASVAPTKNLQRVEFYVDGQMKASDTGVPFEYAWDTKQYPDGHHTLRADAVYKQRRSSASLDVTVANTAPPPPPPPPPGDPYFNPDISDGKAKLPWTTMFSYTAPGYLGLGLYGEPPASQTADGRVAVVADPAGSAEKCIRFESRNSDPPWPGYPFNKSEIRTITSYTLDQEGSTEGLERWFSWEMYLPYSAGGEQFNWPTSGSDTFFTTLDLHANAPGITQISWYSGSQHCNLRVPAGFPTSYGGGWTQLNMFRILNADGSRYIANYNRWIPVIMGVKYGVGTGTSTNGWVDVWVDGVNVIPQRPTVTKWPGDDGSYYKHGLYKSTNGSFGGNGTSVIYYRRDLIGRTKADVG